MQNRFDKNYTDKPPTDDQRSEHRPRNALRLVPWWRSWKLSGWRFYKTIWMKTKKKHLQFIYKWACAAHLENLQRVSITPVVALSVEQGLGITVKRLDWVGSIETLLSIIKGYKAGCLLDGVQRLLVLTTAEEGLTALCPRGPAEFQIWYCYVANRTVQTQVHVCKISTAFLHCVVTPFLPSNTKNSSPLLF